MSDRVAKSEIEDVLSSIRRLVSEKGHKLPLKQMATSVAKPDRLVLTPALRVGETAETADKEPPMHGAVARDPEKSRELEAGKTPGAPANMDAEAAPKESGGAQAMVLSSNHLVKSESAPARGAANVEPEVASAPKPVTAGGIGKSRIEPLKEELADSLSAKIEALETAIAQTEDQWEPDGDSDDAYAGTRVRRITLRLTDEPPEVATDPEGADQEALKQGEESGAGAEDAPHVAEEADAPQFVHMPSPEERAAPAGADREGGQKGVEGAPETGENDLDLQEAGLDEEALRLLVADIVREELQGALGERITRNVRKLVRREIQIALAARDLK